MNVYIYMVKLKINELFSIETFHNFIIIIIVITMVVIVIHYYIINNK